jgi:hypothetical protein
MQLPGFPGVKMAMLWLKYGISIGMLHIYDMNRRIVAGSDTEDGSWVLFVDYHFKVNRNFVM